MDPEDNFDARWLNLKFPDFQSLADFGLLTDFGLGTKPAFFYFFFLAFLNTKNCVEFVQILRV